MSPYFRSILTVMLTLLLTSEPAAAGWITEIVRQVGDVGSWSSLAVFSGNGLQTDLHLSYYDATNRNLKYARKIGGRRWTSVTVARRGNVGESNALALTSDGQPRIAYHDVTRGTISYVDHSADRGWRIDILRNQWYAEGGYSPSLVLDSRGRYHIIHEEHVVLPNGSPITLLWYITPLVGLLGHDSVSLSGHAVSGTSSLAVAGDDTLHVAYMDKCSFRDCEFYDALWLVYASNTGLDGTWEMEWIKWVPDGINASSIAVDPRGAVHIVYADRLNGLKYLTKVAGQWTEQVIDNRRLVNGVSMKLDSAGHLHISYRTPEGRHGSTLRYSTNKSGAWVNEAVDRASRIGDVTSIGVDRFGQPHISYYDATSRNLRHAVKTLGVVHPPTNR